MTMNITNIFELQGWKGVVTCDNDNNNDIDSLDDDEDRIIDDEQNDTMVLRGQQWQQQQHHHSDKSQCVRVFWPKLDWKQKSNTKKSKSSAIRFTTKKMFQNLQLTSKLSLTSPFIRKSTSTSTFSTTATSEHEEEAQPAVMSLSSLFTDENDDSRHVSCSCSTTIKNNRQEVVVVATTKADDAVVVVDNEMMVTEKEEDQEEKYDTINVATIDTGIVVGNDVLVFTTDDDDNDNCNDDDEEDLVVVFDPFQKLMQAVNYHSIIKHQKRKQQDLITIMNINDNDNGNNVVSLSSSPQQVDRATTTVTVISTRGDPEKVDATTTNEDTNTAADNAEPHYQTDERTQEEQEQEAKKIDIGTIIHLLLNDEVVSSYDGYDGNDNDNNDNDNTENVKIDEDGHHTHDDTNDDILYVNNFDVDHIVVVVDVEDDHRSLISKLSLGDCDATTAPSVTTTQKSNISNSVALVSSLSLQQGLQVAFWVGVVILDLINTIYYHNYQFVVIYIASILLLHSIQ